MWQEVDEVWSYLGGAVYVSPLQCTGFYICLFVSLV